MINEKYVIRANEITIDQALKDKLELFHIYGSSDYYVAARNEKDVWKFIEKKYNATANIHFNPMSQKVTRIDVIDQNELEELVKNRE